MDFKGLVDKWSSLVKYGLKEVLRRSDWHVTGLIGSLEQATSMYWCLQWFVVALHFLSTPLFFSIIIDVIIILILPPIFSKYKLVLLKYTNTHSEGIRSNFF